MPRRRIPNVSVPRRPDQRRPGGNAIGAQRRGRRGRPGQLEAIAERRVRALELRKAGAPYREIARQLGVDTHTAWADVASEIAAIREQTVAQAEELRALELERLDGMTSGLWPSIQDGSAAAVSAGVRVSERRSRLLGLDAPVVTKGELTGSLGVYPERLAAERALFARLDVAQLEELAAASQALVDRAMAMARGQHVPQIEATLIGVPEGGESTAAPAQATTGFEVGDTD